ncbi:SDR family NAD(P)-dependent oxidoreductase [Pinirhizobacter sp.]|jgi:NAD(P)-dependent dehydrogenase (short-subunit alcohol dehydrogenase family)|uniref:SDR family NAD(P)-dependent oxidoreductase n=1 Tax=Pinirhizobacter sp. TaxID=2950432 RepID=UPI002F4140D9
MQSGLEGRVVVVTGASKGMGLACATALAREGATVAGISRSREHLELAQGDLHGHGLEMAIYDADLSDAEAARDVLLRIGHEIGPVDVLVNSAGAARRYPAEELDMHAFEQAFGAKYYTYVNAIEAVIRGMAERGRGSIVSIVGQGGRQANEVHIAGGSANAALMLATVGYARAYARKGVRVNAINPGYTRTGRVEEGLNASMRATGRDKEDLLDELLRDIPMGRMAEPAEIAAVAVFLASDLASYVTGAIIPMDGGKASVI